MNGQCFLGEKPVGVDDVDFNPVFTFFKGKAPIKIKAPGGKIFDQGYAAIITGIEPPIVLINCVLLGLVIPPLR